MAAKYTLRVDDPKPVSVGGVLEKKTRFHFLCLSVSELCEIEVLIGSKNAKCYTSRSGLQRAVLVASFLVLLTEKRVHSTRPLCGLPAVSR